MNGPSEFTHILNLTLLRVIQIIHPIITVPKIVIPPTFTWVKHWIFYIYEAKILHDAQKDPVFLDTNSCLMLKYRKYTKISGPS